MSGASLTDSPISSGGGGPSQSGPIRGGDLALGGINIGPKAGVSFTQLALFAGIGLVIFLATRR